jgi:uncharacterized protein DUF2490
MRFALRRVKRWSALGLLCAVTTAAPAHAQATGQAWTNVTIDWLPTNRLSYEVDLEPKAQLVVHEGQARWADLDATPQVEYAIARWIDVLGEVDVAYQAQTDEVNSVSMTPRIGAQLHILDRILQNAGGHGAANEKLPRRRAAISTLLRLEHTETFYSSDALAKSKWQVRDRMDFAYPLNRAKTTDDGAIYMTSDGELFMPLDQPVAGGAVSEVRLRAGLGYRESFGWRYEALYIWTGERSAHSGAMAANSHAIDVRIKRVF